MKDGIPMFIIVLRLLHDDNNKKEVMQKTMLNLLNTSKISD